jgi:DNA polymerase zeta
MRDEVTGLRNYSREEITFHVLHERIGKPLFASPVVSSKQYAFTSKIHEVQQEKMSYLLFITRLNKRLLMHPSLNVLSKAIQFSLTFGTPLFSTLTRGSQFKVESMMSRVCLLDDFVLLSATAEDVREMEAPTGIPLILEPVSGLYTRPILVFDFQSLYPSIMIAYNYWQVYLKYSVCGYY